MRVLPTVKRYVPVPTIRATLYHWNGGHNNIMIMDGKVVQGGIRLSQVKDCTKLELIAREFDHSKIPHNWTSLDTLIKELT